MLPRRCAIFCVAPCDKRFKSWALVFGTLTSVQYAIVNTLARNSCKGHALAGKELNKCKDVF